MKNNILVVLLIVGFLGGCSNESSAGEYYLIEKSKYPDKRRDDICEKLVKNFNEFKNEPPMVCKLRFNKTFKGLSLPDWKKVEPINKINTIKRILTGETNYPWKSRNIEGLIKRFKNGENTLYQANVDINFDGKSNVVYRIKTNYCDPKKYHNYRVSGDFIYMAESNNLDVKTKNGLSVFNGKKYGTLFLYKGRPYFHSWVTSPVFLSNRSQSVERPNPRIAIYETSSPHTYESFSATPRCEIGYKK